MSLLNWLRRCAHEFDYMRDMTPRNQSGMLACPCHKCGKVFMAECGLDLLDYGTLVQLKPRATQSPTEKK